MGTCAKYPGLFLAFYRPVSTPQLSLESCVSNLPFQPSGEGDAWGETQTSYQETPLAHECLQAQAKYGRVSLRPSLSGSAEADMK